MKMKRILLSLAALTFSAGALAEGHELPFQFKEDTGNLAGLQRGARDFMAYCSGCHSMKLMRYSRIGQDLGISEELMKKNLMFTSDKPGDQIKSSMPAEDSKNWFGQTPPDLTLKARERGSDWIYNYLLSFYLDPSRATGVNNLVLPNASMPHVLWELQGWQVKKPEHAEAAAGEGEHEESPLELVKPGTLSPEEYRKFAADISNFMAYAAEPGKAARISTGFKVMLYLVVFTAFAYALKREYWRDVH